MSLWNNIVTFNYLPFQTDYEGITGEIHLDETPGWEFRSDVKLDLIEKDGDRMVKTGIWSLETGINYTLSETQRGEVLVQKLQNKTLKVVTWFVSKPKLLIRCNTLL